MIPRSFLLVAFILALVLACQVDEIPSDPAAGTPTAETSVGPDPTASAVEGSATRSPVTGSSSSGGTGVLALTPGPAVISEACLDGTGEFSTSERLPPRPFLAPPPGGPYAPLPLAEDAAFKDRLLNILAGEEESYAFVIKDLRSGAGAAHNAGQVFNAASLFKLFVMYEVFNQQAQGLFDWTDELVITPYYDSFGLGPRLTSLCQVLSVGEALGAMLRLSDNATAVLLQDFVGAGNVNVSIGALGVTTSGLMEDGLPITAEDAGLLLEAIALGAAVSREASGDMLQLMALEEISNGLTGGLPAGVVVSHKTGNWDDATHDVGVVLAPFGAYLFVALSDKNHETQLIEALSLAAYEYFEQR